MRICIAFFLALGAHSAPVSEQNGGMVVSKASHETLAGGDAHRAAPGHRPPFSEDATAGTTHPARHSLRSRKRSGHGDDSDPFECLRVKNGSVECISYVNYEQRSTLERRLAVARRHKVYCISFGPLLLLQGCALGVSTAALARSINAGEFAHLSLDWVVPPLCCPGVRTVGLCWAAISRGVSESQTLQKSRNQ
jgi:hypothetical protein